MKHFIWSSQGSAIWEVVSKLQEDATQVDVYLHTAVGTEFDGHGSGTLPRAPNRKKKSQKGFISFPAHKLILAAASPFLKKVLSEHYHDHHDICVDITIPHVLPEALHCILNFLYCGTTTIPSGIRESVLEAASLLQIRNFTDHYPSSVKLEGLCEQESVTLEDNENGYETKTTEALHQRQGRRKRPREEQNAHCNVSTAVVKIKMESVAEQSSDGGGSAGGIVGIGTERKRRKVKSRYSADIYEVTLPRMRKWRRRKLQSFLKTEKETIVENPIEIIQQPDVFQEPQKHTLSTLLTKITYTDQKSNQSKLKKPSNIGKVQEDFAFDLSSTCDSSTPPPTTSSSTEKGDKTPTPQLPLTLASTPSSSIIMPNIFVTDQPYLPNSTSIPHTLTEISCASDIVQEDSVVVNERPLEPPTVAISSQPPSLLSEVKELPLISSSPLESFPLKQMTSLSHHKISDTPQEDKNEAEQADGLFKFQVLLKECEDFPDEMCPVPESSQGNQEDSDPGKGNVDINQWISEIHTCVIPSTNDCNKETSQCEVSVKDSKKKSSQEPLTTEDTKTPYAVTDKSKGEVECEKCGKRFSDYRSCQSHIRGVHDEAKQMCRYCGKMFRRRCDLYQHERRHRTASLPCTYCGKIFKVAKDLQAHILTHVGGKRFHCSHCSKELTSYRNLKNHIASIHQKHKPFTCQVCKKKYSKACSLQVHMRSVHTGERPFKCGVCGKTFCDAALLKNHQVVHTGERKYSCRIGSTSFPSLAWCMEIQGVWPPIQPVQQHDQPPAHPHQHQAIPLPRLPRRLQDKRGASKTQMDSHRTEATPLSPLLPGIPHQGAL